jgi:hypothetical protein
MRSHNISKRSIHVKPVPHRNPRSKGLKAGRSYRNRALSLRTSGISSSR